jgi:hypothetical protein
MKIMKKMLVLLLAATVALTACSSDNDSAVSDTVTDTATDTATVDDCSDCVGCNEREVTQDEDWEDEKLLPPVFPSPNGEKSARIYPLEWEVIGQLFIADSNDENSEYAVEFDNVDTTQYTPKRLIWLDDEIVLVIIGYAYGTITMGGEVYYYNSVDGSNGVILPIEHHFEFSDLEIDDKMLDLTIIVFDEEYNNNEKRFTLIDIERIYELIESGETMLIEVEKID